MNGSWETGDDRNFVLASTNQVLAPRYFQDESDLGPITILLGPFFDEVDLFWTGYPQVRLQSKSDVLGAVWEDVPNTLGASMATVGLDVPTVFFRLIGP
jgi:hypothetical protein